MGGWPARSFMAIMECLKYKEVFSWEFWAVASPAGSEGGAASWACRMRAANPVSHARIGVRLNPLASLQALAAPSAPLATSENGGSQERSVSAAQVRGIRRGC